MESVNANIYHVPRHYETNLEIPPTKVVYQLPCNYKFDFKAPGKVDINVFSAEGPTGAGKPAMSEEEQLDRATTDLKDRHVALLKRLEELRAKIEKHPAKAASPAPEEKAVKPDKAKLLAEKISGNAEKPVPSSVHSYDNAQFVDKFVVETLVNTGPPVTLTVDPGCPSANSVVAVLKYLKHVHPKKLCLKSHRHSSVNTESGERLEYINADLNFSRGTAPNHCLNVVWRPNPFGCTLDLGPKGGGELLGDRSVVQFLAVLSNLYPGTSLDQSPGEADISLDRWLDILGRWTTEMNKKMRDAFVKELNVTLGNREYLLGPTFSLADLVVWGYAFGLKESGVALPGNVAKWVARCGGYMMFACFELDESSADTV